jgi:hypothetical protein
MSKGKKRNDDDGFTIPKEITWTVEDWSDFYNTLMAFKRRLLKRHVEAGETRIRIKKYFKGG